MKKLFVLLVALLFIPIVAMADNNPGAVNTVASIADLRLLGTNAALPLNTSVNVSSYYGDGATPSCGTFVFYPSATAADNSGTIIQPTGVTTGRYYCQYDGDGLNAYWFGAHFDAGTHDDAAALEATWAVAYAQSSSVILPCATAGVSAFAVNFATAKPVSFKGCGPGQTVLNKFGASGSPILAFTTNSTYAFDLYANIGGFTLGCSSEGSDGIDLTNIHRSTIHDIVTTACAHGVGILGSLADTFYNVNANSGTIGFYIAAANGIYPNLDHLVGGAARGNTSWGMDIIGTNALTVSHVDFEGNGTVSNAATGGVNIASTCASESLVSTIIFDQSDWFEGQQTGSTNLLVGACSGLFLTVDGAIMNGGGTTDVNVGAITNITLHNVTAASANDTVTLATTSSDVKDSEIYTLADTSVSRQYVNLTTHSLFTANGGTNTVTGTLGSGGTLAVTYNLLAGQLVGCSEITAGGTQGIISITSQVLGSGFTVSSTNSADRSTFTCTISQVG